MQTETLNQYENGTVKSPETLTLIASEFHRNGCSGVPFYSLIVDSSLHGRMHLVRLPKEQDKIVGQVNCFVHQINELNQGNVKFGYNSWRGDGYSNAADHFISLQSPEFVNGE